MANESKKRQELLAKLNDDFRQLSAATILFHQAIADRLGMNITDHKCADILSRAGPMTAGQLAKHTGLTTGAITGVIDRLEKKGFARRDEDPHDRRRVIVELQVKRMEKVIGPLFASIARSTTELCDTYSTEQLAVIHDFAVRAREMSMKEAEKLRSAEPAARKAGAPRVT
jgi:DNA-binding MarR family transcriptional regulator